MRIIGKLGNDTTALKVDGKYVAKTNPTNSDPIAVANKWMTTGPIFTVVIVNPCDTTIVDSTSTNVLVASQSTMVLTTPKKEWFYARPTDSEGLLLGAGYTKCGPRTYKIEVDETGTVCKTFNYIGISPETKCPYTLNQVDQPYYVKTPFLLWKRYSNGHPNRDASYSDWATNEFFKYIN
jgi:hypothetical protein